MPDLVRRLLFAVVAFPAVLRASTRLSYLDRHHDLEELARKMAGVRPWRLGFLSNPRYLEACVHRFSGPLPPHRLGACLKRSLLLLDVWSRCGLSPRIHVGAAKPDDGRHLLHAWVTVPTEEADRVPVEYSEIWSYPELDGHRSG